MGVWTVPAFGRERDTLPSCQVRYGEYVAMYLKITGPSVVMNLAPDSVVEGIIHDEIAKSSNLISKDDVSVAANMGDGKVNIRVVLPEDVDPDTTQEYIDGAQDLGQKVEDDLQNIEAVKALELKFEVKDYRVWMWGNTTAEPLEPDMASGLLMGPAFLMTFLGWAAC